MTRLQFTARVGQLSALQSQLAALAIELGIDGDVLAAEFVKTYNEQMDVYRAAIAVLADEFDAAATAAALKKGMAS